MSCLIGISFWSRSDSKTSGKVSYNEQNDVKIITINTGLVRVKKDEIRRKSIIFTTAADSKHSYNCSKRTGLNRKNLLTVKITVNGSHNSFLVQDNSRVKGVSHITGERLQHHSGRKLRNVGYLSVRRKEFATRKGLKRETTVV